MNLLILAIIGVIVVISSQVSRDWKQEPKPKCECHREGPTSATHEQAKGMNGPKGN